MELDTASEADADPEADAAGEREPLAGTLAVDEVECDATADADPDTSGEADSDALTDTGSDAEASSDAEVDTATDSVGGTESDALSAWLAVVLKVKPDLDALSESETEPVLVLVSEAVKGVLSENVKVLPDTETSTVVDSDGESLALALSVVDKGRDSSDSETT